MQYFHCTKGNLKLCDNWRGISLLQDVVGKTLSIAVQDRLKLVTEDILPDSQCGFRAGRECTDMRLVPRQLQLRRHGSINQICLYYL